MTNQPLPIKCEVCIFNEHAYGKKTGEGKPSIRCFDLYERTKATMLPYTAGKTKMTARAKDKVNGKLKDFIDNCSMFKKKWYLFFVKVRDKI